MKKDREQYAVKLKKQLERYCYIPQAGEEIRQCKPPYPDYWFASNMGYVFTAYYKDVKILDDNATEQGLKNKDGERTSIKWRYNNPLTGKFVPAWKVIADTFCECEFPEHKDEKIEIHHIKKRASFEPNEGKNCNRADNLQILPKSIHTKTTAASKKSFDLDLEEKITGSDVPTVSIPLDEFLLATVQQYIQSVSGKGNIIYVNHANAADPKDIEVTVKPLTADDIGVIEE